MPLIDIVVDTNVLMHASDRKEAMHQDSINLLNYLSNSTELLCVDKGFTWDDSNKSLIGAEYRKHIKNGMLAYSLLVKLFSSRRTKELTLSTVPALITRRVNQCISHKKPRDKTFLKVAYLSDSKTLVTHDQEDFNYKKRKHLLETFGVKTIDADEI
ncbi:hypothetical protein [Ferruginibacter sp. HRS2-29]|uniref:hypothetical protein n=1 Tax=Ferruginibacter sp. HRS2-29 TaxID=2487334 RepID=UPI0020CB9C95|nr:hypothetical protein [Ferruginibacter sp. HRS2-29]MCP9752364.1 hypothetical protein [Ferruginibacter sp. HRS2-29]